MIKATHRMKTVSHLLTEDERNVLILAAAHPYVNKPTNREIALSLGISVGKVKRLMHNSFVKLKAHNRIEAIRAAQRIGEISINELYSFDELVELFSSVGPDKVRKIAELMRRRPYDSHISEKDEQIIFTHRRQSTILTNREREVIICVGRGLTNKEIAESLYISISSVWKFINRASLKLGAHNKTDAFMLALKQKEISLSDICSVNELLWTLAPLGDESLEEIARLLEQRPPL